VRGAGAGYAVYRAAEDRADAAEAALARDATPPPAPAAVAA
jgi:hypothetical protein